MVFCFDAGVAAAFKKNLGMYGFPYQWILAAALPVFWWGILTYVGSSFTPGDWAHVELPPMVQRRLYHQHLASNPNCSLPMAPSCLGFDLDVSLKSKGARQKTVQAKDFRHPRTPFSLLGTCDSAQVRGMT